MFSRSVFRESGSRASDCRCSYLHRQCSHPSRSSSRRAVLTRPRSFCTRPTYWFHFVTFGMSFATDGTMNGSEHCHLKPLQGRAHQHNRQSSRTPQRCIDVYIVYLMTYHPVFVRSPLPRDLRGFLPATPLVADNIEHAENARLQRRSR